VHGFASSFELNWRQPGWVDLLTDAGRTVVPVDLPGHGTAPKPHDPKAYGDLAASLAESLPDEPVDAVGFSLGALTLLRLAIREPHRFHRLVVGGVGENVFRSNTTSMVADAIESGVPPEDDNLAKLFVQFSTVPGNDPAALAACMRREEEPIAEADLARITCPTLVVIGDQDFAGPADRLVAALPDARLVVLRNTEHFATPRSFAFIDAALEFLDAVPQ
jgi:pimeloyl-ACP methyl ester carboxylesterase